MSRNVIVIGGVALGPKAASRLKRLDPTANVTMIDENINISFGGCGIPYYVSGEINSLDAALHDLRDRAHPRVFRA